ncbi:hypothetical protein [Desulfolucanica intricata]|uniref:hypothetical protein n=1 Tax=Desulfolucanica intricata TaxID=1285191 RepID=UPI0008362D8B|nr:hypothetical protein [Desulfolucanica intricata]
MELFNKISDGAKNITGGAKFLGKKSGELLEITKAKLEVLKLENELDNNFRALGNLVYQQFLGRTDLEEEINRLCLAVQNLEKDILELKGEYVKVQPEGPVCQFCKKSLPHDANYCYVCGKSVNTTNEKDEDEK